jgi:Flp pilus assembly protein TadG
MKYLWSPQTRRFLRDQRGQSAVLVTVMLFAVMALSAAGVETGHVYYAYRLLQASTKAAALAGAQAMPDITEASTYVTKYSSESNQENASNLLQNDSVASNFYCSADATKLGVGCESPTVGACSSGSTCNALTVTQTASTHLWFGGLVGITTMTLRYSATAAMNGGSDIPYNIAVIIDTTASMASGYTGGGCNGTPQITCAVGGLQTMLQSMDPCYLNTTCTASTPYVDGVALFVFPALNNAVTNIAKDTTCPSSDPAIVPYGFTNVTPGGTQNLYLPTSATLYPNNAGTYEVVPFNETYKTSDETTTLNSLDALAVAAGGGGGSCQGLQAPGGEGTYYAQSIYAAQAALEAQQATYTGSKNIMIILSDGNATSCNTGANTAAGGCNTKDEVVALNCPAVSVVKGAVTCGASSQTPCPSAAAGGCTGTPLNGTGTATTNATGYESPTYPSVLGMCGQAVQAAQLATAAGTTVYTVAMGAETSGSCTSDSHYTISGLNGYSGGQACSAIAAMASNAGTFYSDGSAGCSANGVNVNFTTIAEIFKAITGNLTTSRLIPPGS